MQLEVMEMNNIKRARMEKGLSVKEVAALVGVSSSAVSQWESGAKSPRSDKIFALADALGVSADYVLGEKENDPVHIDMDRVDNALLKEIQDITPAERKQLLAFIAGLKANRAE